MTRYVIDASVAAKWFLAGPGEDLTEEALGLVRLYLAGDVEFLVPDLFFVECGSVLRKAERLGRCDAAAADQALERLLDWKLPSTPAVSLLKRASAISERSGGTVAGAVARRRGVSC